MRAYGHCVKTTHSFSSVYFSLLVGLVWIMQGSNLFTGKLLETGEHIRVFIFSVALHSLRYFWGRICGSDVRTSRRYKVFVFGVLAVCAVVSLRYARAAFSPCTSGAYRDAWQTEQSYAKSFAWLDNQEENRSWYGMNRTMVIPPCSRSSRNILCFCGTRDVAVGI